MGRARVSPLAAASSEDTTCREGDARGSFVKVGSWNVQGLTNLKLAEIYRFMEAAGVDVMCLQETRKPNSDHYVDEGSGCLVILSGTSDAKSEWAGVGSVVSQRMRFRVQGCWQLDNRIASLKLRTSNGRLTICITYAPHSEKPTEEKVRF